MNLVSSQMNDDSLSSLALDRSSREVAQMPEFEDITNAVEGTAAIVTINRPERYNA